MAAAATAADESTKKGKKRPKVRARLSDMETQSVHGVPAGANMRNKPLILKADTEMAVWSTAFTNDLPDSAFLYIAPGGEKDDEGKTVPRTLRYFPVRDQNGALDLPHLRNAIARIPQSTAPGLSEDDKTALQERARGMLEEAQKEVEEMADGDEGQGTKGKQEPEAAPSEGLELSTAHKELLLTGITDVVEKLTGLGEVVGGAAINEDAPVPEDVLLVLAGCSEAMASLVQQASPPAPTPEATPGTEAPPDETEMSAKNDDAADETAETAKAGAMLSRKNRGLVQSAIDALTKLLEAADKEKADQTEKADDAEPEPRKPTVAEQIDGALAPILQRFEQQAEAVSKAVAAKDADAAAKDEQIAKMTAQANSPPPPNSAGPEESGQPKPTVVPYNLSEHYQQTVAAQDDPLS